MGWALLTRGSRARRLLAHATAASGRWYCLSAGLERPSTSWRSARLPGQRGTPQRPGSRPLYSRVCRDRSPRANSHGNGCGTHRYDDLDVWCDCHRASLAICNRMREMKMSSTNRGGLVAVMQSMSGKIMFVLINAATGIITARALHPAGRGELAALGYGPTLSAA